MIPLITPELYIDNTLELKRRRGERGRGRKIEGEGDKKRDRGGMKEREGERKRTLYSLHVSIQYYLVNNSGSNTTIYGLKS